MKIAVAGTGYVGLSISVLLAQHNEVWPVDIVPEKVAMLASGKSPISDKEIEQYLAERTLDLHPTTDAAAAYTGADIIVVSTPTNYDPKTNYFDTSSVENVLELVGQYAPEALVVIKSTVPVGYTRSVREKFHNPNIIFSPNFCGKAMRCMITCTPAGSWWAYRKGTRRWRSGRTPLPGCCSRGPSSKRSPRCSPV